jgi:hypothetical protein
MGFLLSDFVRADLKPRTVTVKVPELASWFEAGSEPVFIVRGLSGEEFYAVREAVNKRRDLQTIASQLLSGQGEAIAAAVEEFYGAVPDEYARQIEILAAGCVDPVLDRVAAMKLIKHHPVSVHTIASEILRATGEGSTPGESSGSGATPASATTST